MDGQQTVDGQTDRPWWTNRKHDAFIT